MNKSMLRQSLFTVVLCGITACVVILFNQQNNKKIAVVDAIKLVNSYKMKMEMEAKSAGTLKFLVQRSDSLKQNLMTQSKVKDFPKEKLNEIYTEYTRAQAQLESVYFALFLTTTHPVKPRPGLEEIKSTGRRVWAEQWLQTYYWCQWNGLRFI
jgi:hypothetical protein